MIVTQHDFDHVLGRVQQWKPDLQLALAHSVLAGLRASQASVPARTMTLDQDVGLLDTGVSPPNDRECEAIVEDHRLRKYG